MKNERSDGILVLGVIAVLFGIWSMVDYTRSHILFISNPNMYSQPEAVALTRVAYLGSLISLIIYPLFIIGGFFVLKLKNWARILLISISVIQMINSLISPYVWTRIMSYTSEQYATVIPNPILLFYIMNIWFFNRLRIKEQFLRNKNK